ncbi:MAG: aspartate kinase [Stomatobaculum sp.]
MKKVVKFGGSSLASAKQFKKVGDIIRSDKSRRYVVPSAPGKRSADDTKVTDLLYQMYDAAGDRTTYSRIFTEIRSRYEEIIEGLGLSLNLDDEYRRLEENFVHQIGRDYAASRGEYLNGLVMAAYLGYAFVDPVEMIVFHDDGTLDRESTERMVAERLSELDYAVIPGFYGAKRDGSITTFSRGGSDVTGSVIAGAIHADLYENWTDVSGFLCADPHIVENPEVIDTITYHELRELSYMGAGVMHEDAIFPVRKEGIPINIRNTNRPQDSGTMIVDSTCRKPRFTITGVAGKKGFCSITIDKDMMNSEIGFCRKVLQVFEDNGICLEHMPSGIDTMTIVVHQSEFLDNEQRIVTGIHRAVHPDQIILEDDLALIAVVGRGMKDQRGTAARVFAALSHDHVNVKMIDQGSSEFNIIVGVKSSDFEVAIRAIYNIFVLTQI